MIVCKTSIGYGAGSKQDSESSHGAPLGEDALNELRENLKWSYGPFEIPESVYEDWDFKEKGKILENNWKEICEQHEKEDPEKARLLKRLASGDLPEGFFQAFNNHIVDLQENTDSVATRKCSQIVLEFLKEQLPELVGGSADLSGSNNTITKLSTGKY